VPHLEHGQKQWQSKRSALRIRIRSGVYYNALTPLKIDSSPGFGNWGQIGEAFSPKKQETPVKSTPCYTYSDEDQYYVKNRVI
jgi:hypothetical protein